MGVKVDQKGGEWKVANAAAIHLSPELEEAESAGMIPYIWYLSL